MARSLKEIEAELALLNAADKAFLARNLIDDLDRGHDIDTERLWFDEAERRYEAYRRGEIGSRPADEVFADARERLRK